STWIRGTGHAYGGIHMLARPTVGVSYREGLVPPIDFDDVSKVTGTGQTTCMQGRCYQHVLVVDETSPNDPASGHQIKYYSPGVGLVRVGARGGDSIELLTLAGVRHLGRSAMAGVTHEVLAMDRRAFGRQQGKPGTRARRPARGGGRALRAPGPPPPPL